MMMMLYNCWLACLVLLAVTISSCGSQKTGNSEHKQRTTEMADIAACCGAPRIVENPMRARRSAAAFFGTFSLHYSLRAAPCAFTSQCKNREPRRSACATTTRRMRSSSFFDHCFAGVSFARARRREALAEHSRALARFWHLGQKNEGVESHKRYLAESRRSRSFFEISTERHVPSCASHKPSSRADREVSISEERERVIVNAAISMSRRPRPTISSRSSTLVVHRPLLMFPQQLIVMGAIILTILLRLQPQGGRASAWMMGQSPLSQERM